MPQIAFSVTITGAEAVRNAFKGIGDAARAQQDQLERANRRSSLSLQVVSASMKELRGEADLAFASLGATGNVLRALSTAGAAGAAIAGVGLLAGGFAAAAVKASYLADEIQDSADAAGISTAKFQSLRFALAGVGVDEARLSSFLSKFTRNLGDLQTRGVGPLQKALEGMDPALLRSVRSAPTVESALQLVLDRLISLPDAASKASLAAAAFGRGAGALVPILRDGADGLRALEERARETGAVIDGGLVAAAGSATDRLDQLGLVIRGNLTAALIEAAPLIEAAATKLTGLVGAIGRFYSGRQRGEVPISDDVSRLTQDIARAERELERTSTGSTAREETAARVEALVKERDALLEVVNAQKQKAAEDQQAAQFVGPPEPTKAEAAAAERAADKAAADLKRAETILAEARRQAALANTSGPERIRTEAAQDIERQAEQIKALVPDAQRAADLIEHYRVERNKVAEAEITKQQAEEAEKRAKQQAEAERRARRGIRQVERELSQAGGDTESSIWERARQAFEDYRDEVVAGIEDQEKRAALLADYWVKQEQLAQAKITELRQKAADKAADEAERAARQQARTAGEAMRELERVTGGVARDLSDGLVDALFSFEDQARSTTDVVRDLFQDLATDVLRSFAEQAFSGLAQQVVGQLGGLVGGGAPATAAATTQAAQAATSQAAAATASTQSLLKLAGAAATAAGAVAAAGVAIGSGRQDITRASYGQTGPGNAYTVTAAAGTAIGVGSGAAIGAAVGTAVPGIGNIVGALVGAAVGGVLSQVISQELGGSLSKGISDGVSKGVDQAGLDRQVAREVGANPLLNILSGGLNTVLAPLLSPLFTPDIERIFEKILRQQLGGEGGFSTAGIPVDPRGSSGLRALAPTAGRAGRLIAEGFGAGGEAYGAEREGRFRSLLLAVTRREADRTGEEAGVVLAQVFAAAFQGSFTAALKAGLRSNRRSPFLRDLAGRDDLAFAAEQFGQASPNFGFNYQAVADVVRRQDRAPGQDARKAATEAFTTAFREALTNAADSSAFRKSMANAVTEAFAGRATQLLSKSFGDLFAPFFSLSRRARRQFRRQRRRGDFSGGLQTLTKDFLSNVEEFAKVAADPAIARAFTELNDAVLKLQVSTSLAAGDVRGAADAIESVLAASIQVVRDYQQLDRDIRSRTRLAEAGPGVAQDRVAIEELRRQREEAARRVAEFGLVGFDAGGQPFGSRLVGGETRITPIEPAEYLGPLREFAEARLAELEAEIALARQLQTTFEALAEQAQGFVRTIDQTLGQDDPTAELARVVGAVTTARDALGGRTLDTVDPDEFTTLATKLGEAIGVAAARFAELTQAITTFDGLARGIAETLGGPAFQQRRLTELLRGLPALLPVATGGGAGAREATSRLAEQMSEAVAIASQRRSFFASTAEGFGDIADQAAVQARGRRAQRQQLARARAELAALVPAALSGDADALARAQALSSQVLNLAGQTGTGRRVAREVEAIAQQLATAAQGQQTIAEEQLEYLQDVAETAREAFERQRTDTEEQLGYLREIAELLGADAADLAAAARERVSATVRELVALRETLQPLVGYLTSAANTTLHDDLARIERALGPEGALAVAIVTGRLPQVTTNAARLTNAAAPTAGPQVVVNLTVNLPAGATPAQARELGRSTQSAVEEAVVQAMRRTQLKAVA